MNLILSARETSRLKHCEGVIRRGLETFYEVGLALAEIRDSRLYRLEFETFENYCAARWGMAARTAHQTIRSAGAVKLLGDCEVLPERESVARVLSTLDPSEAKRVWLEAIAGDERITAQILKRLIARASHNRQGLCAVSDVTCPRCAHVFRRWRPESASRGNRNPSRGVKWALTKLPADLERACDYGCGRFRNAGVLEERFRSVVFVDTEAQCERIAPLRGSRDVRAVGEAIPAPGVVFVICVLHILANAEARAAAAEHIERLGSQWLVIETPRHQPYYRGREHSVSREGGHYWNLSDAQLEALFPAFRVAHRTTAKHNSISIFARNCAHPTS